MIQKFKAAGPLSGEVRVPGDKSISHRALMIAALAEGTSRIQGLSPGLDVASTAACMRELGASFEPGQAHGGHVIGDKEAASLDIFVSALADHEATAVKVGNR